MGRAPTLNPSPGRPVARIGTLTARWLAVITVSLAAGASVALEGSSSPEDRAAAEQVLRQQAQPLNNQPVWSQVRSGVPQSTAVIGRETGVLIQASGERWRQLRNGLVQPWGAGWLIVAFLACLAVYLLKGPQRASEPPTGRLILRFRHVERFMHWTTATLFVLLAVSGLILSLGRYVLQPLIGLTLFGWLGQLCKVVHNLAGPLFAVFALAIFLNFVRDALPRAGDLAWLRAGGGIVTGKHVPAGKLNAGQKLWVWGGVFVLGSIVSVSGFVLDFPNFDQSRATLQLYQLVHGAVAMLFIGISFGHIYLGWVGQEGALEGMKTGYVDESWAKAHHELWYNDVKAGKVPQSESGEAPHRLANP